MLISQRVEAGGRTRHPSYGAWNEAEEVLALSAGMEVAVVARRADAHRISARRVLGRAARRTLGRRTLLPATAKLPISVSDDHVFFVAHGLWDLPLLERLRSLRRRGLTISVWISEVWPSELADHRVRYESYSMIDHVFVAMEEAVEPLAAVAPDTEVHFLPPAADVLLFAPDDPLKQRGISVLGIGRRDPEQHEAIKQWATDRQHLYLYDTIRGYPNDWREHRDALASHYQHANIALCNYAKHDMPELIDRLRLLPGTLRGTRLRLDTGRPCTGRRWSAASARYGSGCTGRWLPGPPHLGSRPIRGSTACPSDAAVQFGSCPSRP